MRRRRLGAVLLAAAAAAAAVLLAAALAEAQCPGGCHGNGWWNASGGGSCECVRMAEDDATLSAEACCLRPCDFNDGDTECLELRHEGSKETCRCTPFGNMFVPTGPHETSCCQTTTLANVAGFAAGEPHALGGPLNATADGGGSLMTVRSCVSCDVPLLALVSPPVTTQGGTTLRLVQFSTYEFSAAAAQHLPPGRDALPHAAVDLPWPLASNDGHGLDSVVARNALAMAVAEDRAAVLVLTVDLSGGLGLAEDGKKAVGVQVVSGLGGPGPGAGATPVETAIFARDLDGRAQASGVVAVPGDFFFAAYLGHVAENKTDRLVALRVAYDGLRVDGTLDAGPCPGCSCAGDVVGGVWYCAGLDGAVIGLAASASSPLAVVFRAAGVWPAQEDAGSLLVRDDTLRPLLAVPHVLGGGAASLLLPRSLGAAEAIPELALFRLDVLPGAAGGPDASVVAGSLTLRAASVLTGTRPPVVYDPTTGLLLVVDGGKLLAVRPATMTVAHELTAAEGLGDAIARGAAGEAVLGIVDLKGLGRTMVAPVTLSASVIGIPATHVAVAGPFVSGEEFFASFAERANLAVPITAPGCAPGFLDRSDQQCVVAEAGNYTKIESSLEVGGLPFVVRRQQPCPAGTHSPRGSAGVRECAPCGLGTYQPEKGQGACLPCPDGKYCPLGSAVALPLAAGFDGGPAVRTSLPPGGGGGASGDVGGPSPTLWFVLILTAVGAGLAAWLALDAGGKGGARAAKARALLGRVDCCYARRHWTPEGRAVHVRSTSTGGAFSVAAALVAVSVCVLLLQDYVASNEVRSVALSTVHRGVGGDLEVTVTMSGGGLGGLCTAPDGGGDGEWSAECTNEQLALGVSAVPEGLVGNTSTACRSRDGGASCDMRWRCGGCSFSSALASVSFVSLRAGAWVSAATWSVATPSVLGDGTLTLHGRLLPRRAVDAEALRGALVANVKVSPAAVDDRVRGTRREGVDLSFTGSLVSGVVTDVERGSFWPDTSVQLDGTPAPAAQAEGSDLVGAGVAVHLHQDNVLTTTTVQRRQSLLSLLSSMSGAVVGVIGFAGALLLAAESQLYRKRLGGGGDAAPPATRGDGLDEPLLELGGDEPLRTP